MQDENDTLNNLINDKQPTPFTKIDNNAITLSKEFYKTKIKVATYNNNAVAVKRFYYDNDTHRINTYHPEANNEVTIIKKISNHTSSYILRYHGYIIDKDHISIVMDFATQGSLEDYLNNNTIDIQTCFKFCKQFLCGLETLHSYNIVHFDLRPDNLFVDADLTLKIADFDKSMIIPRGKTSIITTTLYNSKEFIAPENLEKVLQKDFQFTVDFAKDIYAASIICCDILFGSPYPEGYREKNQFIKDVISGEIPDFSIVTDKPLKKWLTGMSCNVATSRPTASIAKQSLAQIERNWASLISSQTTENQDSDQQSTCSFIPYN